MTKKGLAGLVALSLLFLVGCAVKQAVTEKPSLLREERAVAAPRPPLPTLAPPAVREEPARPPVREAVPAPPVREEVVRPRPPEAPVAMMPRLAAPAEAAVSPLKDIYFDFDKYNLREDAKGTLTENSKWLLANKTARVEIQGHADERGSDEYNLALGERRAAAARAYLQLQGVAPERMATISYGEFRPADPRKTEEAYAKNRRDHFVVPLKD